MTHNQLNYLEILHQNGCRLTTQRQAILDAVCMAGGRSTVGQVYRSAKALDASINRSTIYRTLNLFARLGLVFVTKYENGERGYEMAQPEQHHHLVCKVCHADIEIDNKIVDDFYQQLSALYDYDVSMDHLIVAGLCAECAG